MATTSKRARTPLWALVLMLVACAVLVPLFLLGNSEDLALSGSTTGRQLGGGEERTSRGGGGTTTTICRAAPVEYEVDGRPYETLTFAAGECVPDGEVEPVTVRYDPDDPTTITTQPRQWILYGFVAVAALGFVASLVALLRRLLLDRAARRSAPTP